MSTGSGGVKVLLHGQESNRDPHCSHLQCAAPVAPHPRRRGRLHNAVSPVKLGGCSPPLGSVARGQGVLDHYVLPTSGVITLQARRI